VCVCMYVYECLCVRICVGCELAVTDELGACMSVA